MRSSPVAGQPPRAVARRQIVAGLSETTDTVEIRPMAIVPLEHDTTTDADASLQLVEIAPIDVEPLRVSQLELVE